MNGSQLLNLATVAALSVFGARAAQSILGDASPSSLRSIGAEIVGAMIGAFLAAKVRPA